MFDKLIDFFLDLVLIRIDQDYSCDIEWAKNLGDYRIVIKKY